ncbi:MAG: DUF4835 family protein [Lentimicrobiaceae bacterium]|nr:DUF4835 family protein [Lentimicrobiaceae bacterium]
MKRLAFLLLLVSVFTQAGWGQELACRVTVTAKNLQGPGATSIDKTIFTALEQNISAFINERKWTNYNYKPEEKIDCSIQIEVERAAGNDMYEGKLYAQLSRPVFNSAYYSPVFTYQDNYIIFRYNANQTFEYDENSFIWSITSLSAYYANLFLGLFYDAQSLNGGTDFYNRCMNIINSAPSSESGWSNSSREKGNRYWLLESFTNPSHADVRNFLYAYHRQGLDLLAQNMSEGLNNITAAIEGLQQVYTKNPTILSIQLICLAKSSEFVNVYSGAGMELKQRVVPIFKRIDAANTEKYEKLLQR